MTDVNVGRKYADLTDCVYSPVAALEMLRDELHDMKWSTEFTPVNKGTRVTTSLVIRGKTIAKHGVMADTEDPGAYGRLACMSVLALVSSLRFAKYVSEKLHEVEAESRIIPFAEHRGMPANENAERNIGIARIHLVAGFCLLHLIKNGDKPNEGGLRLFTGAQSLAEVVPYFSDVQKFVDGRGDLRNPNTLKIAVEELRKFRPDGTDNETEKNFGLAMSLIDFGGNLLASCNSSLPADKRMLELLGVQLERSKGGAFR